jgi:3,4-dihydroxy 2-butanone 4-phosphate synthase/GTP cyclohydrolase II
LSAFPLAELADEPAPISHAGAARVAEACDELARGRLIVLSDGTESALVLLGCTATTAAMARMIREGSGLIFAAVPRYRLDDLRIPRMTSDGTPRGSTSHVAVDAVGVGTGISATDRAHTLRQLSDSTVDGAGFVRPGHVLPVAGDLTPRLIPGAGELALTLARLTDHRTPVAAYCALTSRTNPQLIADAAEGVGIAACDGLAHVNRDDVLGAMYRTSRTRSLP